MIGYHTWDVRHGSAQGRIRQIAACKLTREEPSKGGENLALPCLRVLEVTGYRGADVPFGHLTHPDRLLRTSGQETTQLDAEARPFHYQSPIQHYRLFRVRAWLGPQAFPLGPPSGSCSDWWFMDNTVNSHASCMLYLTVFKPWLCSMFGPKVVENSCPCKVTPVTLGHQVPSPGRLFRDRFFVRQPPSPISCLTV
jgi:hypothetical protein